MSLSRLRYTLSGDAPDVDVGFVLRSSKSWFVVVSVRKIQTRDGARRFDILAERRSAPPEGVDPARIYSLVWFSRRRKR